MLHHIGDRVRATRRDRGESRAALAVRSGLSVRFLAQLEAGAANISVLRLLEVAQALGLGLGDLLGLEPRSAEAPTAAEQRKPVIALLGLRGAGKSSVGARLARALGVAFFELDALVEERAGLPLEQIFELQGQAAFRRFEREALARFLAATRTGVLATGGGLVTEPETYAFLRRGSTTVWLRTSPEQHWQRVVQQGDRRPMRDNPAAMQELRGLLAARIPLYAQADLTIDTTGRTVAQVAAELARRLRARG
jgi:XRE family aerobic/anaerobic benzoate catabolism transcriptional regulator